MYNNKLLNMNSNINVLEALASMDLNRRKKRLSKLIESHSKKRNDPNEIEKTQKMMLSKMLKLLMSKHT